MSQSFNRPPEPATGTGAPGTSPLASGADGLGFGVLVAALVLGACRFVDLGAWSLWLDEAYTLADSRHGETLANPVGYALFGFFYDLFPERPNEWILRLPAACLGFLSIPLTAWALRPFLGFRAAAIAALIVAVSPWHLYWSQNARFYTLAQVLGLVGGGLVARGLLRDGAVILLVGLASLGVAALVQPSAALLVGAFLVVPWILRRWKRWPVAEASGPAWKALAVCCVLVPLGAMPWVIKVWRTWDSRQGEGDPVHFVLSVGYLVSPFVALGVLLGLICVLRSREKRSETLAWLVGAALTAALIASFLLRVSAQYVFVLFPWIAGVAAVPFLSSQGTQRLSFRLRVLLMVLVLPLALESTLYFAVRNGDRPKWREAYAYVFEHRAPTDLLLGMEAPVAEYYLDPEADDLRDWRQVALLDNFRARLPNDWARYERRTWFVMNLEQLEDWDPVDRAEMRRILEEECTLEARFEVPWTPRDLDVLIYVRD